MPEYIKMLEDSGFQGICDYHKNSIIPFRASKKHKLSTDEKVFNRELSKKRIYIEHINRYIKRFRILSSRYRNKRRKFALRVFLICAIFNLF